MSDPRDASSAPLPPPPQPRGQYTPAMRHGALLTTAGMTPRRDGELLVSGRVGATVDLPTAREAAELAAENALAALAQAAGGLDQVAACLRLTVYIACTEDFTELSTVADGASGALRRYLGDAGRAARSAIGVQALPGGAPVEVELTAVVHEA